MVQVHLLDATYDLAHARFGLPAMVEAVSSLHEVGAAVEAKRSGATRTAA